MLSSRISAALAAATLVLAWTATGRADDTPQQTTQSDTSTTQDSTPSTSTQPTTSSTSSTPATTTTTQATYDPNAGAEQREEIRPNVRVLVPSALVFAGAYGTSAIIGAVNDRDADHKLAIPLVGPWLDLADRNCEANPCENEGLSKTLLVASGVLQAIGVGGAVASFFIPETRTTRAAAAKPHVNVLPLSMGKGGAGLGAVGTF